MKNDGEEERVRIILLLYETLVSSHLAYKTDKSIHLKNTKELGKVKQKAVTMIKRVR